MNTHNTPEATPHVPATDSFQIGAALDAIRHAVFAHLWLVLMTTLLTVFLVMSYVAIWPKTFQTEVMVSIDADNDHHRNAFYQGWNIFRKDALADEATMMTSPPVLREVIERLDLTYDEVYHPFSSYVVHLWGESTIGQAYRRIKYSIFPQPVSPFLLPEEILERAKVLKDFQAGVNVQQVGEANIGLLIVKGSTQRVAEIANTMVDVYLEQRRQRFVQEAENAHHSLSVETHKALEELREVEAEMKRFYSDNGMLMMFEKERVEIGQLMDLRAQVVHYEAQIAEGESAMRILARHLADESGQLTADRVFQDNALKDRLIRLEVQLADALQLFLLDSPEVQEIEQQIQISKAGINSNGDTSAVIRNMQSISESYEVLRRKHWELESRLQGDRAALKVKRAEMLRMEDMLAKIPGLLQSNHEFERQQVALESKYHSLNEKLTMAAVSMASAKSAPPAMRVIEYASPPEKPIWPKTKLLVIAGGLFGLLSGVIGALLLDLIFVRVNRYRLWSRDAEFRLFAIVDQDEHFLETIFPRSAVITKA